MAKRAAEEQIGKGNEGNSENKNEEPQQNFASPGIMATRKILKPKGRNFQFSREPETGGNGRLTPQTIPDGTAEKFKALANKFLSSIQRENQKNAIPDYRPIAQKYLLYYEELLKSQEPKSSNATVTSTTENSKKESQHEVSHNPFANIKQEIISTTTPFGEKKIDEKPELDSEDDEKKEIEIQGPKFSLSTIPITKHSTFSFGTTKAPKKSDPDSDSDSEIEIKGPSFTFTKEIKDPIFKLKPSLTNGQSTNISNPEKKQELNGAESAVPEASRFGVAESSSEPNSIPQASLLENQDGEIPASAKGNEVSGQTATTTSAGEDGEENIFQVKAKLMLLKKENATNPYQTIGIGELKVLRSEERGSLRVLIRAEGGLRLLLNALLIKDVDYTTLGNGSFVRFPALDESHQIVTYIIKVGTAENGKKLCDVFNTAKVN